MTGLDIGCGKNKRADCVGLDMNSGLDGIDYVHEIRRGINLPFTSGTFDVIYMNDVVEHVDDIAWLLSEAHRIGQPNAPVHIQYPHHSGRNAYGDVTHRHFLGLHAFDHFDPEKPLGKKYQYYTLFGRSFPFSIDNTELTFKIRGVSEIICWSIGRDFYESLVSRALPISTVNMRMRILK